MSIEDDAFSVLVVEGSSQNAEIVRKVFEEYFNNSTLDIMEEVEPLKIYMDTQDQSSYDIMMLDLDMEDGKLNEFIPEIVNKYPGVKILATSGQNDIRLALNSLKEGATNYICKDNSFETDFMTTIYSLLYKLRIERENRKLRDFIFVSDNFPSVIFKLGDFGPEPVVRDFESLALNKEIEISPFLMQISISILTAVGQGQNYNEGFYLLPAGAADNYRLFIFSIMRAHEAATDERVKDKSLMILAMFVPANFLPILPNISRVEDEIIYRLKSIKDVDAADEDYLNRNKQVILDWLQRITSLGD